jgi:predicted TPR repeat methyltransferase
MTAVETTAFSARSRQDNPLARRQSAEAKHVTTVAQNVHAAMALHRRGELRRAERLYRAVLEVHKSDFDCLHNLGLLCAQEGRLDDAIGLLRAGARQDPRSPEAHNNLGNVLAMMRRHDQAAAGFRTAIALRPDFAEAHNNLASAMAAQGKTDEAARHYRQAIALRPTYGDAHLNLGRILSESGELDAAEVHYRHALALGSRPAETHCRLGDLARMQRKFEAAGNSYQQAIAHAPNLAQAWLGLGHVHYQAGRYEGALAAFARAPEHAEAWLGRGRALRRLKRPAEAIFAYRQALAKGADADVVGYYLAALGAESAPPATPSRLVRAIFDRYSERYDQHVVERLKYRTPDLLYGAVVHALSARCGQSDLPADLRIVDLGCGTGLVGALFRPLAGHLLGIDISARMLEQARRRQIYDDLAASELIDFLRTQTARFDLALAADVLVYLGDLAELLAEVRRALRSGGYFGFSVEAAESQNFRDDFVLRPNLRYAHSAAYLQRVAEEHGLVMAALETKTLRREDDSDVIGHLAILRRP